MSTPKTTTIAIGVAAGLALASGTVAAAGAAGGPDSGTTNAAATTKGDAGRHAPTAEQRKARSEARDAALAKALGVPTARLDAARKEVRTDARERRAATERERAEARGVTVTQLRATKADRLAKRLATAVRKHRLTQAQADAAVAAVRAGTPPKAARKQAQAAHRAALEADRAAAGA